MITRQGISLPSRRQFLMSGAAIAGGLATAGRAQTSYAAVSGVKVRDCMWLWGTLPNVHENDIKKISKITAIEAAGYLGIPNMIMGGGILPSEAAAGTVQSCKRVLWKLDSYQNYFLPEMASIHALAVKYPHIEAVMIDDLTSVAIGERKMPPSQIAKIAYALQREPRPLMLWGTVYTMNLGAPNLKDYLNLLNVVDLWVWRAADIPQLRETFNTYEKISGGKPTVLGLYMFDFGDRKPMPVNLMESQCELALELLKKERITGIVFLSSAVCDVGLDAVQWTKEWIASVADQMLPPAS